MPPSNPAISVVIPTLNRPDSLLTVLGYFRDREPFRDFELIVVDQSDVPDPSVLAFIAASGPSFHMTHESFKQTTRARNRGIELARGGIVVFSEDDVEPWPGLLQSYAEEFQDPAVQAVTGPVLHEGEVLLSEGDLDKAYVAKLRSQQTMLFNLDFRFNAQYGAGGNSAYRTAAFAESGPFDLNYVGNAWGEEHEFGYRFRKLVGPIVYSPKPGILHKPAKRGGSRNAPKPEYIADFVSNSIYTSVRTGVPVSQLPLLIWRCYRRLVVNRSLLRQRGFFAGTAALMRGIERGMKVSGLI